MTERYLGAGGRSSRVAVVDAEPEIEAMETVEAANDLVGGETVDPLYPVALLKIAMAMRRMPAAETRVFDALLEDVLSDMVIDRDDFRGYLERNMARLVTAVKMRGY